MTAPTTRKADIFIDSRGLRAIPLEGIGRIKPGDDLNAILADAIRRRGVALEDQDIIVVTSKIVSKARGRTVRPADVSPSADARELAERLDQDPRKIQVILNESKKIIRADLGVLICETRHGLICANAGVDASNLDDGETLLLLPEDPDAEAESIRRFFAREFGVEPGVIITDSFGRPWRLGVVEFAIGVAGCPALVDIRGRRDYAGRELTATELGIADEVAAVAGLAMGKLSLTPAALIQGLKWDIRPGRAADLLRPAGEDLFR